MARLVDDAVAGGSVSQNTGSAPQDADAAAVPEAVMLDAQDGDGPARRPWLKPVLFVVLALAVLIGGYQYWHYRTLGQYMQSTNDAFVSADDVSIAAKLAGYVKTVRVSENAMVEAGQRLLDIDPTDYANRIDEANAQIGLAQANEAATLATIGEAQPAIVQAQAEVDSARRQLAYLNDEIARYRPLVDSGAEPQTMLDQLVADRDKAVAMLRARLASVGAARQRIASIRAQSGASSAQVRAAQVQLAAARSDLDATRLTAPLGGRVASMSVRTGQFVQPGQRLMTIVPTGDLFVEANFKETQIGLMRPGQPAIIAVDALPGVEFRGVVESITPGTGANFSLIPPQNATGNFTKIVQRVPVRIRLDVGPESRKVLVPGLSLEVTIDTRSAKGAIAAIEREQDSLDQNSREPGSREQGNRELGNAQ